LLDLCKMTGMRIVNGRYHSDADIGRYTCHTAMNGHSTVDYMLATTPHMDIVSNFVVEDMSGVSRDHCPLSFNLTFKKHTAPPRIDPHVSGYKYVWSAEQVDLYKNNLASDGTLLLLEDIRSDIVLDRTNVSDVVAKLTATIEQASNPFRKVFSTRTVSNNYVGSPRWWNDECYRKKGIFQQAWQTYKYHRSNDNYRDYQNSRSQYRNCCRYHRKRYDERRVSNMCFHFQNQPKLFWKELKRKKQPMLPDIPGHEIFNHFSQINGTAPDMTTDMDQHILETLEVHHNGPEPFDPVLDSDISHDEVVQALKQLKSGKAPGADKLLPELLIHGQDTLIPYFTDIFQYIFDKGVYPETWAEGTLQLIYKKGDRNDPGNYRDITLLSCLGKLFDQILYNRLKVSNIEINEAQCGFRQDYSTVDNVFVLQALISKSFMDKQTLYCAFIDLKRAFNSIYRQGLWYKLISSGYGGRLVKIVKNMYEKIKCRVRLHGGNLSEVFVTMLGLQQGAILSAYLFSYFLNDLPDVLNSDSPDSGVNIGDLNVKLLMYADDMVVVSNSIQGLQKSLDVMYEYFTKWKLTVNLLKSNILVCKPRGGPLPDEIWTYGGEIMNLCTTYNYLGITFTARGINNSSLDVLVNQANKSLATLQSNMAGIGTFPPAVSLRLFHTCVTPVLCYGSEVWGYQRANKMQCVLNKWCKRILGVKNSTCNAAVAGELGQYPLIIMRKINMLKYWLKIVNGSHNRLRYIMYSYMKTNVHRIIPGCSNWSNEVKTILIEIGKEGVWHNEVIDIDTGYFLYLARVALVDLYVGEWRRELASKEKMASYILYKTNFGHELYLSYVSSPKCRKALSRLRLSSHGLNIETGRYHPRVPRHRRLCTQCGLSDIEDEYHFILVCNKYLNVRNQYMPRYYREHPTIAKYSQLMSDLQTDHVLSLGVSQFIVKALMLRG